MVTTGEGRYQHFGEVATAASQLKHYVKRLDGSNYLIERRDSCVSNHALAPLETIRS